jgi:hypothetical protein
MRRRAKEIGELTGIKVKIGERGYTEVEKEVLGG